MPACVELTLAMAHMVQIGCAQNLADDGKAYDCSHCPAQTRCPCGSESLAVPGGSTNEIGIE